MEETAVPSLQVVILAAGMGTRLGRSLPKPLTQIYDGRTIINQQLDNISEVFGASASVTVVVGHQASIVIDATPKAQHILNRDFNTTNTSKSLLAALRSMPDGGVLWMNGDVVFHPDVLRCALTLIDERTSFVIVDRSACGDEEVKYTTSDGYIDQLSKSVANGLGEAVGINYVSERDRLALTSCLTSVEEQDYFERGIELAIAAGIASFTALDITGMYAVEVDDEQDLERANRIASEAERG
jgi:choline kinase